MLEELPLPREVLSRLNRGFIKLFLGRFFSQRKKFVSASPTIWDPLFVINRFFIRYGTVRTYCTYILYIQPTDPRIGCKLRDRVNTFCITWSPPPDWKLVVHHIEAWKMTLLATVNSLKKTRVCWGNKADNGLKVPSWRAARMAEPLKMQRKTITFAWKHWNRQ